MTAPRIWVNGALCDPEQPVFRADDRGLTHGDGVFDTLLAIDGRPLWAADHLARLSRHADQVGIRLPYSTAELTRAITALLDLNGFMRGQAAVKTVVTAGPGARGLSLPPMLSPAVVISATQLDLPPSKPLKLSVSKTPRERNDPLLRIKSLCYLGNRLALEKAKAQGADDVLFLNTDGHATAASSSNLFIVENGRLLTPPLTDGVMDGIVRARLIEHHGAAEDSLPTERLMGAQAVFLTNSIRPLQPVAVLDNFTLKTDLDIHKEFALF